MDYLKIAKKYFTLIVSFSFFLACKQNSKEEIVVGFSAQYPPLTYVDNGEFKGFDIDLSKLIAEKLNSKIKFKDMQFQSLFPAVNSKKIDFGTGCITITEERKKNFDFSIPYRYENIAMIFRKDGEFSNLEGAKNNKKIGVQFGNTIATWARANFDDKNIVEMDNMAQLIEALKNKSLDAVLTSTSHGSEFSERNDGLSWVEVGTNENGCGILFKKGSSLVKPIDDILIQMIKNSELEKLEQKWKLKK